LSAHPENDSAEEEEAKCSEHKKCFTAKNTDCVLQTKKNDELKSNTGGNLPIEIPSQR
jgi:hypothetical protein